MQGLILAAGEGTRLRPLTFSTPKQLIPLLGKPMIFYVIEDLVRAGIRDIGLVVGRLGWMFQEVLGDGASLGVRLSYIVQERRLGIAHAINLAISEGFVRGPFVVYLGDNLLSKGVKRYVDEFRENASDVHVLLTRVRDPSRFGVAVLRDGKIVRLVEKPREPISDLAVVGVYMFRDPDLVAKAFRTLKPSWRGEYEITELIQWFIDHGYTVTYNTVQGWWKDIGTPESLLEAIYLLLDEAEPRVEGEVRGEVIGRAVIERGAIVEGRVYGPVYIGRGTVVSKSTIIEHYVSLESNVRVKSGFIARSLVMDNAVVDINKMRLVDSIIGRRSYVKCSRELHGEVRLAISDYSRIEI